MADLRLSARTQSFIFEELDSVELLETLLLLSSDRTVAWDADAAARELRSSPNSIRNRFEILEKSKLISLHLDSNIKYVYSPSTKELESVVTELTQAYKIHRSRLVEMIFFTIEEGA